MAEQAERTNPEMVADLIASCARLTDRQPVYVRRVHDLVLEQLKQGPKVTEADPWEHIAQHLKEILPSVMRDPEVLAMVPAILDDYARLPATADTKLRQNPGDQSVGPYAVIGVLTAAGLALAGIIAYCLSDVTADPGTSAEVPHLGPFC
jgi:hypothetical protein